MLGVEMSKLRYKIHSLFGFGSNFTRFVVSFAFAVGTMLIVTRLDVVTTCYVGL